MEVSHQSTHWHTERITLESLRIRKVWIPRLGKGARCIIHDIITRMTVLRILGYNLCNLCAIWEQHFVFHKLRVYSDLGHKHCGYPDWAMHQNDELAQGTVAGFSPPRRTSEDHSLIGPPRVPTPLFCFCTAGRVYLS